MKHTYLFVMLAGFLAGAANAYDTGAMTCDDVGQYAAAVMTEPREWPKQKRCVGGSDEPNAMAG